MTYANPPRGIRETPALLGAAAIAVFFSWLLFFSPLVALLAAVIPDSDSLVWTFALTALRFLPLWLLAWFTPRLLGRASTTLLRTSGAPSWRWLCVGFGSWLALSILFSAVEWLISPADFRVTFTWANVWLSVAVAVFVLPLQTSAEELVFRGLIPQALGGVMRSNVAIALLSGLLFALPHLFNPEAANSALLAIVAYGALGAGWSYAVLRTGGLEVALGAHLANNIFSLSIVGYENSALPSIAVWTTPSAELAIEAVKAVLGALLWVAAVSYWSRTQALGNSEG